MAEEINARVDAEAEGEFEVSLEEARPPFAPSNGEIGELASVGLEIHAAVEDEDDEEDEDVETERLKAETDVDVPANYGATGASWEQVKLGLDNTPPGQRSLHVAVVYQQSMYIFGGYDGNGRVEEFHRFDFVNMSWQLLNNMVDGEPPSARDRHSGVVVGDYFLVFGGFDGLTRVNDLHIFSFENMRWEIVEKNVSGCTMPSCRHSHSAVAYQHSMYIFGGYDGGYKNDLYSYTLNVSNGVHLGEWHKVEASGKYPQARYRASCVTYEDKMILFGGHDGQQHLNCTHLFEFKTDTWSQLYVDGPIPLRRDSHVALVYNDAMFIFGGSSGNAMNDFHYLSLKKGYTWKAVSSDGWSPCSRFCHVAVEYDNSMYVFGGYDGNQRLKDFHRFKFAPGSCNAERSTLVDDLGTFVKNDFLSDVTFVLRGVNYPGHRVLVNRCSSLLESNAMVETVVAENGAEQTVVRIDNTVRHETFVTFLNYLYTDKINLSTETLALEVYSLADTYKVERLKRICLNFVSSSLTVSNAAVVFQVSDRFQIEELRARTLSFILQNFDVVSKTSGFEDILRTNVDLVCEVLKKRGEEEKSNDADPEMSFPPTAQATVMHMEEFLQGRGRQWLPVQVNNDKDKSITVSKRSLHAVAVYDDSLYLFGGYTGEKRVNEFFRFSFTHQVWSHVDQYDTKDSVPSSRDRHTAVVVDDQFWVFGGYDGKTRTNKLHSYNFRLKHWSLIVSTPNTPSARHSHCAAVYGNSFYIFGGYDGSFKNDLSCFDVRELKWERIITKGRNPTPRYRATLVNFQDSLYLFAGHDGQRHMNDIHVFNCLSQQWSSLQTTGSVPVPRDSHCSVVYGNHMYVFGGSSGSANNDFYKLRLKEGGSWQKVSTTGMVPSPRFCHAAAVHKGSLYVFGGYDGTQRLRDFIEWSFTESRVSLIPRGTLVNDLGLLLGSEKFSDITFIIENKRLPAHKIICSRCRYFEAMFLTGMRESRSSEIVYDDIRYDIFRSLLLYLYTDKIDIPLENSMELFVCADRFGVDRLRTMCENKMLSSIDIENVSEFFAASDCHFAESLHDRCLSFIILNFDAVSKTTSFENMIRSNVELLIKILRAR